MPVVLKPYCNDCHMELEAVEMPTGNRKLMSDEEETVWGLWCHKCNEDMTENKYYDEDRAKQAKETTS